jgi:hypothetical protein
MAPPSLVPHTPPQNPQPLTLSNKQTPKSFPGNVANPVPVEKSHVYFRGSFNLDRTLAHLFQTTSITKAKTLVVTGGSAGGSTLRIN